MLNKWNINNPHFFLKNFLFKFFQTNHTFLITKFFFLHNYYFKSYNSFFFSYKIQVGFYVVRYTTINAKLSLQKWLTNFISLNKKRKQLKTQSNSINLNFLLKKIKSLSCKNKNWLMLLLKKIKPKNNIRFFRQIWLRFYRNSSVLYLNSKTFSIILSPLYKLLLRFLKKKRLKLTQLLKLNNTFFRRRNKLTFRKVQSHVTQQNYFTYYSSLQILNGCQRVYLNYKNTKVSVKNYSKGVQHFKWKNVIRKFRKFKRFRRLERKRFKLKRLFHLKINTFTYTISFFLKKKKSQSSIKNLYKYKTKSISSFILRNNGIFLLSKFFLFKYPLNIIHSRFKKKMFSFLFPEEKKKFFFLKRKKKVLTRLLTTKTKKNFGKFNSYNSFYRLFKILNLTSGFNKLFKTSYNLNYANFLQKEKFNTFFSKLGTSKPSVGNSYQPFIKRIRFKPGYQRIWRQVRLTLQETLNVKFQYQKRLTKYLMRFIRFTSKILFNYTESTLDKILIFSKLLPNKDLVDYFFKKKFIYVNNKVNNTYGILILMNDFIQLIITLWYYILSRWFLNMTIKRIKKFKRLVFQKNKPYRYKLSKNKKTKSNYIPNWIYSVYFDDIDIKPHLEVDFFTLSTYIITEPYLISYFKPDDTLDLNQSIYLLYNWKYIT